MKDRDRDEDREERPREGEREREYEQNGTNGEERKGSYSLPFRGVHDSGADVSDPPEREEPPPAHDDLDTAE